MLQSRKLYLGDGHRTVSAAGYKHSLSEQPITAWLLLDDLSLLLSVHYLLVSTSVFVIVTVSTTLVTVRQPVIVTVSTTLVTVRRPVIVTVFTTSPVTARRPVIVTVLTA